MASWLAVAALSVAGCTAPDDVQQAAMVVGQARAVEGVGVEAPEVRYCEYFMPQSSGSLRVVYYRPEGPAGSKIAEKWITEGEGASGILQRARPQVSQEDFRMGEVRQASLLPEGWKLRYKPRTGAKFRDATFAEGRVDVVDAGFDAYVRQHWQALTRGEKLEFEFASPVHGRTVGLRAAAVPCQRQEADLCIRVDLAQAFLRWIAGGDIYLEYVIQRTEGKTEPRLLRFVGVTNLLDDGGDSQRLVLDYFYRE
ncbi:hypothetical protein JF535_10945 [Microbulbifer salipaludis]|uniref:Lipoprotein n=1 Tax=Microbulbifer salipaludis TaxID=187980 RepID=A0ABS3E7U0_9GAMM|nr:hypothetical protein [Microbulbifer salipaludis]MBN8431367.1 hypothetical protein [Microbulbifer salipaludis]